jgi:hypothetical protein
MRNFDFRWHSFSLCFIIFETMWLYIITHMAFAMENCVVRTHFLCFVYINYVLQVPKSCNVGHTGKQNILTWQLTVQMTWRCISIVIQRKEAISTSAVNRFIERTQWSCLHLLSTMLWYQPYCWSNACFHSEDAQCDRNGFLCQRDAN